MNIDRLYWFDETFKMHHYFCWKEKQLKKICKFFNAELKADINKSSGRNITLETNNNQTINIIFARDGEPSVLAHECVHAGIFTMSYVNQEVQDDEVLPLIVESLVRNFIRIKSTI